ncbi:MAG TPA: hypothetical protein VK582_25270 [Pyrinomonadaceae bacterium]|nr:hypothetical protein [Pyrinomonadaceae bacterium]
MKKTKPVVIPIENGKAELVVQDAESYQELLVRDRLETIEGIKSGLESTKYRRGKPATEFFREFFAEKGIPEHE